MSGALAVRAAPGFAGGRLRTFNRVLFACARAGAGAGVTLVLDERLARDADLTLRVQNAHGDPAGLPAPFRGVFRDERERAMFAAAVRDVAAPAAGLAGMVNDFLPAAGVAPLDAALELWPRLVPGLRAVAAGGADEPPPAEEPPSVTWLGEHQRRALADLGLRPEELLAEERARGEAYRPALQGELAAALDASEEDWSARLAALRRLALEVDDSLLGSWSRMERTVRRGLSEFRASAERCLDSRAGIRRARWHHLYQALRPAGEPQEEGYSLLHAVAQLGLTLPAAPERWEAWLRATREIPGNTADPLFLHT